MWTRNEQKRLHDRNSPTCTLSQTDYGEQKDAGAHYIAGSPDSVPLVERVDNTLQASRAAPGISTGESLAKMMKSGGTKSKLWACLPNERRSNHDRQESPLISYQYNANQRMFIVKAVL